MSKIVRAKYEKGVFKPLEPVDLEEDEEVQIIIRPSESIADKFYGIAKKRRPDIRREEFLEVLKEIENEDFRGH